MIIILAVLQSSGCTEEDLRSWLYRISTWTEKMPHPHRITRQSPSETSSEHFKAVWECTRNLMCPPASCDMFHRSESKRIELLGVLSWVFSNP